jgi:hypothetical protein
MLPALSYWKTTPSRSWLVNVLLNYATPSEAVRRALDAAHANAVIFRVAAGVASDDDVIAGFQRIPRYTFTAQLTAAAPFDRPSFGVALIVWSLDMHKGVRVPEHKLNQLAFDGNGLVFEVSSSERVVSPRGRNCQKSSGDKQSKRSTLHRRC